MGNLIEKIEDIYIFTATILNSSEHRCFRAVVHKLAVEYCAHTRIDFPDDGIIIRNNSLHIKLVFLDRMTALKFRRDLLELPVTRRKQRRLEDNTTITDLHVDQPQIVSVEVCKSFINRKLIPVDVQQYEKNPNDESPNCDIHSKEYSTVTDVFVDDSVRMKLISRETSVSLCGKKAEKCYLKSLTHFPELKDASDNFLYMDGLLHYHFDGICTTDGVPHFILEYHSHNLERFERIVTKGACDDHVHVYETTVTVTFLDDYYYADSLKLLFREFEQDPLDNRKIRFNLYFEDPLKFHEFAQFKANQTRLKWQSFAGTTD